MELEARHGVSFDVVDGYHLRASIRSHCRMPRFGSAGVLAF